jgi:uncharacterized coiled-coil DUF342 family protein
MTLGQQIVELAEELEKAHKRILDYQLEVLNLHDQIKIYQDKLESFNQLRELWNDVMSGNAGGS